MTRSLSPCMLAMAPRLVGCVAVVGLALGCRTVPKDGPDLAHDSGAEGITEGGAGSGLVDSGTSADTGAADGAGDGGDSAEGGDDASDGEGSGGDEGAGDSGSGDGGGSGDTAGSSDGGGEDGGSSGGDGSAEPEEVCNGIDDDGDGLIDEDACPDAVITDASTGRAYMVVGEAMQWFDAAAYCVAYGYTLATVDDQAENDFIWELIYDGEDGVHTANAHAWIGLHEDVGTAWAWHDGTATGGFDAASGDVVTDDYGTVTHGQAMAFGDEATAVWFEAPQTWFHHAVCESAAP